MKKTIEIYVTDCRDCIFRYDHRGHGECWAQCDHEDHGRELFENILWGCQEEFKSIPEWCPLGL